MAKIEFRVIDPVRRGRVASDPRESYRFLRQVSETPLAIHRNAGEDAGDGQPEATPQGEISELPNPSQEASKSV